MADVMNQARNPALDGVRGVAIIAVLIGHGSQIAILLNHTLAPVRWITSFGGTGVDLFFVLSGFLITGGLLDTKGREAYFLRFYWRRTLRILPLYYGVLAATLIVTGGIGGAEPWFWFHLSNWTRLALPHAQWPPSLAVTWSLAIEEQFYAVWPLVVLVLPTRAFFRLCVGVVVLDPFLRLAAVLAGVPLLGLWAATPFRLDGLAAGAALAVLIRQPAGLEPLQRWARPVFLATVGVVLLVSIPSRGYALTPLIVVAGYSAVVIAAAAFLVMTLTRPDVERAAQWAPLRLSGRLSYALYLFHLPLLYWLARLGWAGFAAWVPLSLGAAWLSGRYFEGPILSLKHWTPGVRRRTVPVTAEA